MIVKSMKDNKSGAVFLKIIKKTNKYWIVKKNTKNAKKITQYQHWKHIEKQDPKKFPKNQKKTDSWKNEKGKHEYYIEKNGCECPCCGAFISTATIQKVLDHILFMHISYVNSPQRLNSKYLLKDYKNTLLHPYFITKDCWAFLIFNLFLIIIICYYPERFANPVNYIEANPSKTPKHIIPE